MTTFNREKVDHLNQPMFFGEELNTARYDVMKYPRFDDFIQQQLGYFWRPEEVDISDDINDFKNKLTPQEQRVFILNLQYQTLLDSVQGRSPNLALLPIVSLPELETWIETWSFSETIHSRSYTYIIKNVFDNPSEVLDQVMEIPEITRRASMVTEAYDCLIDAAQDRQCAMYFKKLALFKAMISVYALEAIRFYVSFACTFSFADRGVMEGNGKIMKFIARDEFLHQGATHYILTRWLKGQDDPVMQEIVHDNMDWIEKILLETYKQEVEWAEFLFCEGSIRGLNLETIKGFLGWITNTRLNDLGIEGKLIDEAPDMNPIPWIDSYLESSKVQIAPQEAELSSYVGGAVDNNDVDIEDFEL